MSRTREHMKEKNNILPTKFDCGGCGQEFNPKETTKRQVCSNCLREITGT